jgi:hypothetical protein
VLVPWVSNHYCEEGSGSLATALPCYTPKVCTIDGQWTMVGMCNLDRLSLAGNDEINVVIYSAELARQMSALFAEDTAELFELIIQQWKSRPWYNKVSERILAPLRFMMCGAASLAGTPVMSGKTRTSVQEHTADRRQDVGAEQYAALSAQVKPQVPGI